MPDFSAPVATSKRLRSIPQVSISGSSSSPMVLSPQFEEDFFLCASGQSNRSIRPEDLMPSIVTGASVPNAMPLFSPSETAGALCGVQESIMEHLAFADANPVSYSLPTPPDSVSRQSFRLPSFDLLGIGPGSMVASDLSVSMAPPLFQPRGGPLGPSQSPLHACYSEQRIMPLMTPPEEDTRFQSRPPFFRAATFGESDAPHMQLERAEGGAQQVAANVSSDGLVAAPPLVEEGWLEAAIRIIVHYLDRSTLSNSSFKVLSHALPSPSVPGHAFPTILDTLREMCSSPLTWVNLLHAVPGRFNLADLPKSPPTTPGPPLGDGDDYFATKVFESAITAMDYDAGDTITDVRHQPLAPPSSINLSIVERYIPPTSPNEFTNLFNTRTPSLLVDRLAELTPGNGCLVFIYPTKAGAKTFTRDYIGPILDPLLRSMVVVNNFSADLSANLGRMPAAERLLDFATMHRRTLTLLDELNTGASAHVRQRLHNTHGAFELAYAAKQMVELERHVWADWWVKQEKPRVRSAIAKYFGQGVRSLRGEKDVMPAILIQEILDGVARRPYAEGMGPGPGPGPEGKIEVAVFVVRRGDVV